MKISALIKSLIIVFLFSCFFSIFSIKSFAQTKTAQANLTNTQQSDTLVSDTNSDVPDNLHNWTQTVTIEVLSSFSCQLSGIDPINAKQGCLGIDQKTGKIGFLPSFQAGGLIGFMSNMIAVLYTPPLHTTDYFQNLASSFGIVKKTYAAPGEGFESLKPLMTIWTAFRNIVYLLLVVVFVIIGLAIMLRIKIDPRTVMTIQNQIPKIIIGILAVTFSFAIAGFLIDMMWVLIFLVYNTLSQAAAASGIPEVIKAAGLQTGTPFGTLGAGNILAIISSSAFNIGKIIFDLLSGALPFWAKGLLMIFAPMIFNPLLWAGIGGLIAWIVIAIIILIALFRLWIALIKAYVQILLDVVLAPFWIIGGIIPGSSISFGGWLKDIIANLLAFPATIALLMLAVIFKDIFATPGASFVPPLIGNMGTANVIGPLIALGIILMTPNVVNMIKKALKATKFETGIGAAVAGGVAMVGRGAKSGAGMTATYYQGDPYTGKKGWPGVFQGGQRKLS
jgi:hypothetical protein